MGSAWPKPIRSPKNTAREATAKHESADSGATFKAKPGRILAAGFRPHIIILILGRNPAAKMGPLSNAFWVNCGSKRAAGSVQMLSPLKAFWANYKRLWVQVKVYFEEKRPE